jgi:hypothetical protein
MYSLATYKEQCYNPGNPNPAPARPPLNSFPKSSETEDFDFTTPVKVSPIKLKISDRNVTYRDRKCKRKLDNPAPSTSASPLKKAKMLTKDDLREMFEQNNKDLMDKIDKKLDSKIEQGFASLTSSISTLQESMNSNNAKMENRMSVLEDDFTKFQDNVIKNANEAKEELKASIVPIVRDTIPEIRTKVKNDVLDAASGAWKANLADKVREHEHSAIAFGLKVSKNPMDDAHSFLEKDLKMNRDSMSKIYMKHAVRLGRGDGKKPPGLLMTFSHPGERNLVLSCSKNLKGTKIKLEKHVPKLYQKEHKSFKNTEWKLKNMPGMNYQTQIIFDGYKMLLRYKVRDTTDVKYQYVIHSEYYPPMDQAESEIISSIHIPAGSLPTPVIPTATATKAAASFFVSGMTTERTEDAFTEVFKAFVNPGDKASIVEIKLVKPNLAVIFCKSWGDCSRIVDSKKDSKLNDEKVSFTLFSENPPKP